MQIQLCTLRECEKCCKLAVARLALIVALTRAGARHRLTDTHSKTQDAPQRAATVATAMQHLLDASARFEPKLQSQLWLSQAVRQSANWLVSQ